MTSSKSILTAIAVSSIVGISVASAADLPARTYAKAPAAVSSVYDWTGFYVGGTVGGDWGTLKNVSSTPLIGFNPPVTYFDPANAAILTAAGLQKGKPSGVTGGLEAGYNWQTNNFVVGVESDFAYFRLKSSLSSTAAYVNGGGGAVTINSNSNTDWLFTARPRIGYAMNNWLVYATGGLAVSRVSGSFPVTDTFGVTESGSVAKTQVGYAVGGGVEAGFWRNWTVKAEYLYVDLGKISTVSNNLFSPGVGTFTNQPFTHSVRAQENILRVGLNYHFNGPVVAKY